MIVKLFESSKDGNFGAVKYNEEKIEKNKGILLTAKNFPESINPFKNEEVKAYLKSFEPENKKFSNIQFHAVISTNGREHSKEQLNEVANDFMKNYGYEAQPFIVVFHNDTKNNHVHIVSTNVNIDTNRQMVNSHTKLKVQMALKDAEKNILGINYDKKLDNLLDFKCQNMNQLSKVLEKNGYNYFEKDGNFNFTKNGVVLKSIPKSELIFSDQIDKGRAKQIAEILKKYKDIYDNNCFVISEKDKNIEWKSKLQLEMKSKFGLDVIFSFSENKNPFGYTIIDNKNKSVFKGSDVADMKNIFNFTAVKVEKQIFKFLENSNFKSNESKAALKFYLESKFNFIAPENLLDFGKKIPFADYSFNKSTINGFAKGNVENTLFFNAHFSTVKLGDNYFVFNERDKYVFNLKEMVNDKTFNQFEDRLQNENNVTNNESDKNNNKITSEEPFINSERDTVGKIIQSVSNTHSNVDSGSEPIKKRRKRKSKR
jgi:hypothetical protein